MGQIIHNNAFRSDELDVGMSGRPKVYRRLRWLWHDRFGAVL